ncbi:hypothetical protein Tco_0735369 [Tanacetum coccineum]
MNVSPIPTTRIHKDHPKDQIIGDINSAIQTRKMTKISKENAMMDVKSSFLYGTIEEEMYLCQPPGFEDPYTSEDSSNLIETNKEIDKDMKIEAENDSHGLGRDFFWISRFYAGASALKESPLQEVYGTKDMGEDSTAPTDSYSTPIITQLASSRPQKKKSRKKQRKDNAPTEPITEETTHEEHVSTPSYDPPQSGENRMKLTEFMDLYAQLQSRVLDLEKSKTTQAKEITSLKKRVN